MKNRSLRLAPELAANHESPVVMRTKKPKRAGNTVAHRAKRRSAGGTSFDPTAKPIWHVIEEIGAAVPAKDWDKVPTDGTQNLDHYLYGHPKKP